MVDTKNGYSAKYGAKIANFKGAGVVKMEIPKNLTISQGDLSVLLERFNSSALCKDQHFFEGALIAFHECLSQDFTSGIYQTSSGYLAACDLVIRFHSEQKGANHD